MPNPVIPRSQVHELAEACSDAGAVFQSAAARLLKDQRRLAKFLQQNGPSMGGQAMQICLYMTAVCLRVFEQIGGRMHKVPGRDIDAAANRIHEVLEQVLPADDSLPARVRQIVWRAQPHLLDEILWALYEREAEKTAEPSSADEGADADAPTDEVAVAEPAAAGQAEESEPGAGEGSPEEAETPVDHQQAAVIFLAMWTAVEAMDQNWSPPADYTGEAQGEKNLGEKNLGEG